VVDLLLLASLIGGKSNLKFRYVIKHSIGKVQMLVTAIAALHDMATLGKSTQTEAKLIVFCHPKQQKPDKPIKQKKKHHQCTHFLRVLFSKAS